MSIYALREAFYDASQEQENEALANLVNAYHKARKTAQEPVLRISLVKQKPRVYVEPDNTMRRNWNE
ncbi:MAG: hypothetical protein QG557_993 [Pseudomonadota bacterium]|nr:hypothetical protein [Pseudomonadota bacterium]